MVLYRDINLMFERHPLTGDIITATDTEAIKKSLKNLVYTNLYESPFQPDKGSNIRGQLFENFSPLTIEFLRSKLEEMIDLYEPRVKIINIKVFQKPADQSLEVTINFRILDLNITEEITVFVERTR